MAENTVPTSNQLTQRKEKVIGRLLAPRNAMCGRP